MAAPCVTIYGDLELGLYLDPQRTIRLPGPLYQRTGDGTILYIDEACTIMVNIVDEADCQNLENADPSAPSPAPVSMAANEGITKEHTRFLISLMREHIESEGDGLPSTLKDLNTRLKRAKFNKKQLWIELAEKLSGQFKESFCPDKVARKWQTLTDAYKKVKDNNRSTGQGAMRFQFFADMDALLGGHHDVSLPVVGTAAGLQIRHPEALAHCSSVPPFTQSTTALPPTGSTPDTPTTSTPATPRSRKRRRADSEVLQYLRESDEAYRRQCDAERADRQAALERILGAMQSAQQDFSSLMRSFLESNLVS